MSGVRNEQGAENAQRGTLTVVPLTMRAAAHFVTEHHRHNKPPRGHKFSIGVCDAEGVLRGVAMIGRPVARHYDDGLTAEVNRTCTDGYPNANSALYGAAWRIASAMGYRRLITYTQAEESGASLTAAGWVKVRDLPVRKSWAEHSVALRALRDPVGNGGVQRALWEREQLRTSPAERVAAHPSDYGTPVTHMGTREDCKVCPPLTTPPGMRKSGDQDA